MSTNRCSFLRLDAIRKKNVRKFIRFYKENATKNVDKFYGNEYCNLFSPDGDFIDSGSQDATYYYINVAPQWQSFNNGNWKALELATRNLASARVHDLRTYTGGFGVLTLADVKGVQQPIYLAKDANNNDVVPAPKYYWKVVHDTNTNTATAFVGINNPHLTSVSAGDIICPDVCSQVSWVTWTLTSIPKGYMYCCTVSSLRSAISYAPNLGNLALLV